MHTYLTTLLMTAPCCAVRCQNLYSCTSKASKLSICTTYIYDDFADDCALLRQLPNSRPLKLPDGWCGLGGHTTILGRFLHNTFFRVFRQVLSLLAVPVPEYKH